MESNRKVEFFVNKLYHLFFGEKFFKKVNFKFDKRNRLDLIKYAIKKNDYKIYLEIGCHLDYIFNEITIDKTGVDPVSGGNFRGTSDQFFEKNQRKFDCIFIDGLHTYQQVKKDILNSLKFLNQNGIIILHDCLPSCISHQRVPRARYKWNGDVWKAIVEIRTKENLDTYTILADQGLGIIKKKKNTSLLDLTEKDLKKLNFKYYYNNYQKIMRTITFDEGLRLI
tara:strand:- start:4268 stop:4942 length:675 start_codon:yes stop_codon:yes gene_type:complete